MREREGDPETFSVSAKRGLFFFLFFFFLQHSNSQIFFFGVSSPYILILILWIFFLLLTLLSINQLIVFFHLVFENLRKQRKERTRENIRQRMTMGGSGFAGDEEDSGMRGEKQQQQCLRKCPCTCVCLSVFV